MGQAVLQYEQSSVQIPTSNSGAFAGTGPSGAAQLPAEPAEGGVGEGEVGLTRKMIVQYKSNSNEAAPFSFNVTGPFLEEVSLKMLPIVMFYNGRNFVSATAINASWQLTVEGRLEFKFTTHAVAPLKKGEVLTAIILF